MIGMFITANQTQSKSGKTYTSYRLVESVRVGNKVNRTVLLNLGSSFDVPKEDWKELVSIVSDKLSGTSRLFESSPFLESQGESIVARLRDRQGESEQILDQVDLSSLRHESCVSVGNERLAMHALSLLGLDALFKHLGVGQRLSKLMQAQIASRMIHPGSERETARWLRDDSALGDLLGLDRLHCTDKRLHRATDKLYGLKGFIESHLHQQESRLFGSRSTIIFYDLTNTWFYGRPKHDLAQFGRNKQKRHDCPQVSLGLCLNEDGFPVRSEILPGAVSEPKSLQGALTRLHKVMESVDSPCRQTKPLVVMDAGVGSDANIAWLNEQGYGWIVVDRRKEPLPNRDADSRFKTTSDTQIKVWRLEAKTDDETAAHADVHSDKVSGQGEKPSPTTAQTQGKTPGTIDEIRLCVYSEAKAMTEDKILSSQQAKFEAALSTLNEGLQTQGRLKNYDKVQRKIGRLIQQYARVGSQYHIEVNASKTHPHNAANLVWKRNKQAMEKDRTKGAYLLRTSQSQWSDERCLRTYWLLNEVETDLSLAQNRIGITPHSPSTRLPSQKPFVYLSARLPCRAYPANAVKAIRHSSPMGRHSTAHEFNDAPTNDSQKPSQ